MYDTVIMEINHDDVFSLLSWNRSCSFIWLQRMCFSTENNVDFSLIHDSLMTVFCRKRFAAKRSVSVLERIHYITELMYAKHLRLKYIDEVRFLESEGNRF